MKKQHRATVLYTSAFIVIMGVSGATSASAKSMDGQQQKISTEIKTLKLKLSNLKSQVTKLSTQSHETSVKSYGNWHLQGSAGSPIPTFESNNGQSFVKIFGRFQLDGTANQRPSPTGGLPGGNAGSLSYRRVRLGIVGQFDKHWIYKFQYDFLGKTAASGIRDAWVGYHGSSDGIYNIFLLGNQIVPFGDNTPSNFITFVNHSLPTTAFRPAREIGLTGQSSQKHWNFWYGATEGRNPASQSIPYGGEGTLTASADLAINFINKPGKLIRLGNSLMYNEYNNLGTTFSTAPDAHYYGVHLVGTPASLGAREDFVYSPDLTVQYNSLTMEANYYIVRVMGRTNIGANPRFFSNYQNPKFSGWNIQAEYFLTGERRPYNTHIGAFLGVHPLHPVTSGGYGAFEIAARLDSIDLNDRQAGVVGGKETNFTAALNWYPTAFTRVDLNYVKVFDVQGGKYNHYSPSIAEMRLQFVF